MIDCYAVHVFHHVCLLMDRIIGQPKAATVTAMEATVKSYTRSYVLGRTPCIA